MKSITTTWTTEDVLRISGGGITTEQAERILEDELYYDIHEGCIAERIRELIVGYVRDEKLKELEREQRNRIEIALLTNDNTTGEQACTRQ